MGFELVGRVWTAESLGRELAGEKPPAWIRAVVLHHTQIPDLAMRPRGLTIQHIITIADWYHRPPDQGGLGWSSGPHFFLDEEQIFGMCDVRRRGVHARSFNASALGIEVLGNYDVEDPAAGRGLRCWRNAAALAGVLLGWLGRAPSPETVLFHRDDPNTGKSCPGRKVEKNWLLQLIAAPEAGARELPAKPVLAFPWDIWAFRDGRWCVPLREFLRARGLPDEIIAARLHSRAGELFWGDTWLPGGYHLPAASSQRPSGCPWAPVEVALTLVGQ